MAIGLYLAVPIGVVALLLAVSGGATLSRGWLFPGSAGTSSARVFGWAQLLIAAALGIELVGLLAVDSAYRSVVTMPGVMGLFFAMVLISRAQRPPRTR